MSIDKLKQAMRKDMNAPMHYLLPQRIKQLLLDGAPGCALSMGSDGNVVFTDRDDNETVLSTTYKNAETKRRIMKAHGIET